MKMRIFILCVFFLQGTAHRAAAEQTLEDGFSRELGNTHDLRLPDWGPYTDKYAGISHIPDIQKGMRFDLSILPGMDHRRVIIPDVRRLDGPFHAWEAASDLSYYSYRYEIDGKDRIYCDVSFVRLDDSSRLVRTRFVNQTDREQSLTLNYLMNMNLFGGPAPAEAHLPEGGLWVDGVPYEKLVLPHAGADPRDNLVRDGAFRGEQKCEGAVNARVLGNEFGEHEGDEVTYRFSAPAMAKGVLVLRYQMEDGKKLEAALSGIVNTKVELTGKHAFVTVPVELEKELAAGSYSLTIRSAGGAKLLLDGFALAEQSKLGEVSFAPAAQSFIPETIPAPDAQSVIQKYPVSETNYGLAWNYEEYFLTVSEHSGLDGSYRNGIYLSNDNVYWAGKKAPADKQGYYTNVGLRPIPVGPKSERTIDALVCRGTQEEVESSIRAFHQAGNSYESTVKTCLEMVDFLAVNPCGSIYAFSQRRMAATILSNVCYPLYTQGQFIRHYQPGKLWLSLYTWDGGFIGLGLAELDVNRCAEFLNTYVTRPGAESAFIHHGSPVPVQIYQFFELWNKTQSRELLEYFYPRMKQYHDFLAGRYGSSTTRNLKSGLIRTWDYFYNSGGWDDYPAQMYVHQKKLTTRIAPAANTAHAIRTAKLLKTAARKLGRESDITEYDQDIAELTKGLEEYAWDAESGYFGYVLHDEGGNPTGLLRDENGVNFNRGMDGVYPFIGGTCRGEQNQAMLAHLKSPKELWSSIGLTAVDQSSPYYRKDGYWNGTVWFPHQWFFWKAMFDQGEGDMAYRIATTAVNLWKEEVEDSWNCYENFSIQTRRGGGWHQFGGLSCPVLVWYHAMFKPGTVSVGFDTWIDTKIVHENGIDLELSFYEPGMHPVLWICLPEQSHYRFTADGEAVEARRLHPGLYEVCIAGKKRCSLRAERIETR